MRFTKIPLIATLMAVALSLLIVLPTLAQISGDRTDGRESVGSWLDVRVADNVDDLDSTTTLTAIGTAFRANTFNARDTFFNGDLYISNQTDAYNTILISAAVEDTVAAANTDDTNAANGVEPCATGTTAAKATIKNNRSGTSVTAYLVDTGTDGTGAAAGKSIFQAIVAVWDQEDSIEAHNALCQLPTGAPALAVTLPDHGDPEKYEDSAEQTANEGATPPFADPEDGWTRASAAVIPARDGDTLTVSVVGVAGSVDLIVDGDDPEVEDVTPAGGSVTNKGSVDLGFTVSDDGSGIRYDGESGSSTDADLQPHNGDGDQRFDEPITSADDATTTGVNEGDGRTMDIKVYFADDDTGVPAYLDGVGGTPVVDPVDPNNPIDNPAHTGIYVNFEDSDESSSYGSNAWTQNRKGVEYALDMRLIGNTFGKYYWQVTVKDRVGNSFTTDGDEETSENEPFSFTIDDDDPEVSSARTGISYKPGKGEIKDRSWIALNFSNENDGSEDRIDVSTVDPGDFTVSGSTVIGVVVPTEKGICKNDIVRSGPYTGIVSQAVDATLTPAVATAVVEDDYYLGTEEKEDAKNITAFDADDKDGSALVAPVPDDVATTGVNEYMRGTAEVKTASKCDFEPRARVYLQLAEPLASDATPTIQLLGGVLKDIAGNNNVTQQIKADDKIAPGVSISISSSSGTSSRAATDDEGSFTVRVESDEDLSKFPRLFFATLQAGSITSGVADELTILDVTGGDGIAMSEEDNNVWTKKVNADSADIPGGSSGDRIVALLVNATDDANPGNPGNSPGWSDGNANGKPDATEKLDFGKLDAGGFLIEIDNAIENATIVVLPSTSSGEPNETESMNPYIQIDFEEANEYGIEDADSNRANKVAIDDDGNSKGTDSHPDVTITSLTLNGEDRLSEVVRVKASQYVLAVTGLAIGEYTLSYSAMDDVGNEYDDPIEFDFEVLERKPYAITLNPGWNLISLPGDPFNPAVGEVIGSDLKADTVLGYQGGEWVTAVKNESGRWQGTLVDIQGGYGYWVRTTVVEDIETVIPPNLPTSVLPTVPVISGWNLLGVVDAEQRKADTESDADQYFTSLPAWRVAYSFNTQQNQWMKLLPSQDAAVVKNGTGYWVWSSQPGTLVP